MVATNCNWTASSDQTWCTVTPSGTGNGTIVATYSQNPNTSSRAANITVTVAGIDPIVVTVTQAGAPCTLTVTPPNQPVTYTAGVINFMVATNCNWTASSDQTWCTVTPSGTGNGTIVATYSQNLNTSPRVANITVTVAGIDQYLVTVTQSERPPTHFNFEGGNPANYVWTIYLKTSTIDGIDMQPMDEIAIFDGLSMVGAIQLTEVLEPGNWANNSLEAFTELVSGQGYVIGHPITIKCWDASEGKEIVANNSDVIFTDPYGGAWTYNTFPPGDGQYSIADISFQTSITHSFNLITGYQFISSWIIPIQPEIGILLNEISNDNLNYVRNSNAKMYRKIGNQWINDIGNWETTEGYLFKMNNPDTFSIVGPAIDPFTPIYLKTGYQFISYLHNNQMMDSIAFNSIKNNLDFVRNSTGKYFRKIGPLWVSGIGNLNPGEGYLVKMNVPSTLIYPAGTKSESTKNNVTIQHFSFEGGNAADPVYTIYISDATINGYSLQAGDEIGVFDGQMLVGSLALTQIPTPENQTENAIPVFATLNSGEGFTANHPVTFKIWSASQGMEYDDITATMSNPYGDAYTGNVFPNSDGIYSIVSLTTTLTGINNPGLSEIAVYPNPNNGTFTLEFKSAQLQILDVKIYNSLGVTVYQQLNIAANGKYSTEIDLNDLPEGIYTLMVTGKDTSYIKKMVIRK